MQLADENACSRFQQGITAQLLRYASIILLYAEALMQMLVSNNFGFKSNMQFRTFYARKTMRMHSY